MSRFLRFCAFLFVLFFTGNVLAAGYTCPTTAYKKYTSCKAGYYMTYNGTYNGTPRVGNACTKCPTGYSCGGGTADKSQDNIVCSAGDYLPANSTACTICPAGSYCPGGSFAPTATTSARGIYSCPAASGSYLDTFTDMQVWLLKDACSTVTSSNTTITASFTSWGTGAAAVTDCKVNYVVTTPCGTIFKDSVPARQTGTTTITYKYDTYTSSSTTYNSSYERGDRYFATLSAGYYLEDAYSDTYCGTSTNRMFYRRASICGGSTYCPGFTSIPLCNSTAGWEYGEPMGMYGCATGAPVLSNDDGVENYWLSDSYASARTDCYVPVDLNKNGGTGTINGTEGTSSGYVECHYNTACSLPSASALTQTGYKFSGGWATTASGTSCSNSVKITAAVPWGDESYFEYFACKNPTYSITLNKNSGGSTGGTSTLYTTKTVGVYLNSARTQSLTTAGTYKVTMPTWTPEYYYSESEYPVIFDARPALGYYSSSYGGTQYVDADGVITNSGLTAAKGYGANATWHAQYDTMVTAPDAPANKVGYTFTGWCLDNSEDCAGGLTVAAGEEFDLNDLDGDLTAMWAPHTTIRITYNGENDADGADYIYAVEGVDGVYLDAAHTKRMTTTTNPITYPDLYTWDVSFTDSYTGTNVTRSAIKADPDGVYNSAGTQMIDSRGYITTAGIAAAEAVGYDGSGYNASWGMRWIARPDACVTVPDAPTRAGYVFNGWKSVSHGLFQPGETVCYQEHGETSLVADWTANKYTITLDNASATTKGTASIYTTYNTNVYLDSSRAKAMTTSANAITVPSRTGYTFGGYYSASGGTGTQYINASGYITSSGLSAGKGYTASKTWYVKWTPKTTTVTLNGNGATTAGTSNIYIVKDTAVYLDSAKTTEMTSTENPITVPARKYTVTYNTNGGNTISSATAEYVFDGYFRPGAIEGDYPDITSDGYIESEGTLADMVDVPDGYATLNAWWTPASVTLPAPSSRTGYTFGGWYSNSSLTTKVGDAGASYTPTANVTLYAKWTANKYTIALDNANATTNGTASIYTTYNTNVYLDSARSKAMTTSANPITKPSRVYTVTYNANGGSVSPTSATSTYTFKGYYSAASDGTGTQYINASGNITSDGLTAGKGYTTNKTWYTQWTPVSVTLPTPSSRTGYTFGGWYKESTLTNKVGDAGASYTPTANVTLYAKWNVNPYTVTFKSGNTVLGTQSFTYGTAQKLTALSSLSNIPVSSANGWYFSGWSTAPDDETEYNDNQSVSNLTAECGGNVTLYAVWTRFVNFHDHDDWYDRLQYYYNTSTTAAAGSAVETFALSAQDTWTPVGWVLNNASSTTTASTATTTTAMITPPANVPAEYYALYKRTATVAYDGFFTTGGSTASTTGTQYFNVGEYDPTTGETASAIPLTLTLASNGFSRTGYTFSKWAVDSSSGTQYAAGASYTFPNTAWDSDATATMVAVWTPSTDTKYVVNHYTKNLGATTYTLNSTDNKTGTTATIVTLANLKKTITGFTYSEGFAGTATKGTTKPTSGAVTTATILADGTRVIDLYYTRNTYTITVAAGNGISTVAASGWTNTGSANMTKSYEYGASIALATVVTPTQKTGYTGVAYTKTSGSGTLSGTSFTVGAGTATITAKATAISAPTAALTPASTTKVYNYQATTLTASNTTSYDSGITVYYKFGNATSSDGTYTYGDVGTTNTTSVAATSHRGTKYYKVQVYATDGTLTSSTTTSSAASVTLNNKTITFNVNGGTLSGTSPLYVSYNNASVYTGATNTTAGTVPTATKTGYTFNGWYTATSGGSQIYNASGTLTSSAVSGYTSGSKWVATADKTLYAQWTANKYTCEPGNYLNGTTCTQCTAGYYCPGNTEFTYNGGIQGRTACPAGTSAAGSDAATDCYFTVTLNKNSGTGTCGGASSTSNGSVTCYYNTACTLPSWNSSTCNITNGTKIFKGWSESSTPTSGATSLTFTAAKTVYAYWVAPTCSVTNGTGSAASTTTNAPKCTVACNTGYKTSGTYTGTVGATSYSYTCSLETYTIAYTLNGGTNYSNAPTSYNVTTSTITLGTPTRSNSTFGGWYTESGFTNKVTQIAKGSTGNKTFYAKWTCNTGYTANSGNTACVANTITVAYNGNDNTGGSAPTSPTSCTYAGTCNAPSNTYIKTGKEFTGWNTKADGTGTSYAAGASISKAVSSGTLTLYAQWKDCTAGKYCPSDKVGAQACPAGTSAAGSDAATDCYFTVTLNKNSGTGTCGGASSTSNGSVTCYYNTACTLPSWNSSTCNITNGTGSAAKVFRGWGTSASATSWVSSVKLTAAATYYAGWTAPTCSATKGTATLEGVTSNKPVCTITCSTGYSQNGGTNTTASFDVTGAAGATSASGTCKARTFTVSFNANGGTGGQSANVTATYDSAMPTISTTKPTKAGCKFNGWYDATSGGTQYYTAAGASARTWNKTANTTLSAQWSCMSVTGPSNQSKVYDGAALTCNGGISVSAPSGATVTYATQSSGTCGTYGAAPTRTAAGTTTVCYKISASGYTDKTGTFNCSVTNATMTVSASDKTLTYNGTTTSNGTAQSCANVTVSVPSSGATVKYNTDGSSTYSATVPTLTNQGSTTVYYQVTASNYTTKTGSYKCTMNPKAMTVSAGNKTKVYDGSALTCSVSVSVPSNGATIKYGTSSGSYTLTSAPTQTNVGSQTVYYQVTGSNFTTKTGSFTCSVTQADGSTTIKDGSTDVTNKSGSTAYPGTKSLTITCAGGATSNITATSGTTSVATTSVSGTSVTLTPKATGSSEITVNCPATTNYKASSATYDWTVTNGTITATVTNPSKTYNGSALSCAGISNVVPSGATVTYAEKSGTTCGTYSSTVPSRTNAGTTNVCYKIEATNYTTKTGEFSCTVNQADNTLTLSATSGSMPYSSTATFTVSKNTSGGTLSVESSNENCATATISGTTVTISSKANYCTANITVTSAATTNYKTKSATYALTVNKGTITLNNRSATSAGTTAIYQTYNTNVYLDNARSKAMTTSANAITVPSRTGYTFGGYYSASDGTGTQYINASGNITSDGLTAGKALQANGTWYAKWTANKYTITLDNANATTNGTASIYTTYNTNVYLDSSRSKAMTTSANAITKPSRVYTVTYNANSGSVSPTSATSTYTFKGYYSAASNGTQYINASGNITSDGLTAGKGYTAAKTWNAQWTGAAVTLPTPSRTGYTFGGWYKESALTNKVGDAGASYTPTANVTLYAKWTPCTYTVKFNSNKPSTATSTMSGTMSNQSFTYDVAQKLTANAFNLPGYTFAGWATSSTGSVAHADEKSVSNLTTTCGGTVNLYAKWTANTITLSWINGSRGTAPTSPASCTYDGTFTTPAAMTATGYTQTHWYMPSNNFKKIGINTSVACTYESIGVYSGTASFTGSWEANTYTIAYDAAGGYLTEYQPTSGMYDASVTISAPERKGYTFTGWKITGMDGVTHTYGDATTTATSISSTKASSFKNLRSTSGTVTFTAQWQINTYTIKYMDGSTEITGLTPTTYNVTTATFNLPTAYKATYKFASWHTDSALTSSVVTRIANGTTGNKVYYVKWSTCPAGSVCDGDSVVSCPAGSYCAAGSSEATPCAKGSYSTGGATTCKLADKGYYVDTTGADKQIACPAGTYGSTTGLTSAACSGKCSAGRYGNATAQTAATCNGACSAGYYCPAGSTSATAYDCDTGTTTASSNNYWTSDSGAGARSSCYRNVVLNKNGMSGTLALPDSSGCKSLDTSTNTLVVYHNTACKLPTTVLSGTATGTTYTGTGTWATSANAASGFVSSITETSEAATVTYYAGKMYTCSAGYYLKANTNGACTACASPYYCTGISKKYYSSSIQGRSACSALDSTKTDGTYSSVSPYNAATTCRFKQEQQTVPTYCETKVSNTMKYTSSGWEANTYSVTAKSGAIISGNNTTGATCSQCAAGTYSAGGTDTTCDAISAGCYGGAGSATACPNQCSAGTYRTSTGGKTQSDCSNVTAGCYGSAGATTACPAVCEAGNYCSGGVKTPCAAGTYQPNTGKTSCVNASAGYYVASEGATGQSACTSATYQNQTGQSSCISCPDPKNTDASATGSKGYYTSSGIHDTVTGCYAGFKQTVTSGTIYGNCFVSSNNLYNGRCDNPGSSVCNAGYYYDGTFNYTSMSVLLANVCKQVPAGKYFAGGTVTSSTAQTASTCTEGSYCPAGSGAPTACAAPYSSSAAGSDDANDCYLKTSSTKYVAEAGKGEVTCAAGGYCPGGTTVYRGGTVSGRATTGGRTACAAGTANPNTGSSASSACVTCAAGKYNTTTGNTSCLTCPANSYCTGGTNKTACNTVAGKLYTKSAEGSDAATDCYVTLASKVYLAKPTDTETTTCTAGYYCAGGDYHYSSTATNQGRSSCTGATYSGAGAASCSNCPSGYTANTSSNKTANTQCQISVDGGHYIAEAGQNSTNWGTCVAGYAKAAHTVNYGTTETCDKCTGATYAENAGQASCTACPTATNTSAQGVVSSYSYWISGGIHTSRSNCQAHFEIETLDHGTVGYYCYVDADADTYGVEGTGIYGCYIQKSRLKCDGGYYNAKFSTLGSSETQYSPGKTINLVREKACTPVGEGYYSPADVWTRTACEPSGLTTCGSGKCANEAADCGRKLHAGNKVIHLRSAERTSPSLRVKVGDTMFYGSLVSPVDGTLKVKNGTSTYSVANDNQ